MKTPAEAKAKTKAKPKSAAKSSKAPTSSLTPLAQELGEAPGLSRKDASALLQDMMGRIAGPEEGRPRRLNGIGVLRCKRPARMGATRRPRAIRSGERKSPSAPPGLRTV
jgi:hypothetical protein